MKAIVTNPCATCLLVIASLAPCAARTAAQAQDLPVRSTKDVQVVFDSLDRNRDAKISRSEASLKGSVSKRFDGIDSDGDGYLSRQEFAARPSDARFE
jgi:type IV pilus biogenesis protein CpaD/CtpE